MPTLSPFVERFPPQAVFQLKRLHFGKYTLVYTTRDRRIYPLYLTNNLSIFDMPICFHTKSHPIAPDFGSLDELVSHYRLTAPDFDPSLIPQCQ